MSVRYQSLDRGPTVDHEREFLPIRDRRDRSLDRGLYFDDEPYASRSARQSPTAHQPFLGELQHQNSDLQRELGTLKKELELTNQKLGSSMHSIKTFWSPELKKERALRKEESAKYSLINDQLKLLSSENQVSLFYCLLNKRCPLLGVAFVRRKNVIFIADILISPDQRPSIFTARSLWAQQFVPDKYVLVRISTIADWARKAFFSGRTWKTIREGYFANGAQQITLSNT